MQGNNPPKRPFDDRAALEELERLQGSIREYRRQREKAEGEFDAFVESFRTTAEAPAHAQPSSRPSVYAAPIGSASAPAEPVGDTPAPLTPVGSAWADAQVVPGHATPAGPVAGSGATAATGPVAPAAAVSESAVPPRDPSEWALPGGLVTDFPAPTAKPDLFADEPVSARSGDIILPPGFFGPTPTSAAARSRLPLILAVGALLLLAAVVVSRYRAVPAPAATPDVAAQVESSSAAPAVGPPAAAPSTGSPAAVSPDGSAPLNPSPAGAAPNAPAAAAPAGTAPFAEIRTVRPAWVRVIVDGRREMERELPADSRIPLPAGTTFVVRAGDAGAVHFFFNGQDQGPLGANAQVVTRTFTAPAR